MSPRWSEIWGRPIDDGYNLQIRLDTIHPDDRATADAVRIRLLDNEPMNTTYRIRRPDGTIRWIRTRVFPVTDKSGRPYRYVGVSEDVTDLRRAEERFAQAQKMDAVGRLAGGVAHDFNNLLTVILSYSDMLLEELSPDDPHRNEIQEIRKAGVSASTLTRQLLVFSRQQVVQPKVMRLNALVADAGKMLKRLIGEHVELATALDPQAGAVKVDAGQLEQVIVNLAVNARDAMPNGGRLMIESKNVEFIEAFSEGETSYPAGRYVTLAVSDNGTGMDAATQARVFEPFFTTKEPGKGTGLGLATVYGIVKQAGGYISLYSEPGSGTSFKIYFPRVDDSLDAPEELAAPLALPRGAETILVVEDEPAVRSLVRQVLERQGYHVLEVPDGESALDIASKHQGPIHLLLTDVVMPRMSGRIVADRFAAIRGDARILFVSGYTDDAIVHHGVLESGLQFLEKPFTPDALARKVREVLDLKPAAPLSSPRGGA
jgi:PAS domain S-box-containing protein